MGKTLQQRRDAFKGHCRPLVAKAMRAFGAKLGRVPTASERDWYLGEVSSLLLPILPAIMQACGWKDADAEQAASDAQSVLRELFDEVQTLEASN